MLDSSKISHLLKFAIPLILFLGAIFYLAPSHPSYSEFLRQFKDEKDLFVADFLEHEIDGQFNGAPIANLCRSRSWTPGLILSCDPPPGGIGEVKNAHLHCVRIAIEMGAELILPDIVRRSDHDITKLIPTNKGPLRGIPLDYFFDRDHLNASLSTHCPQMKLHSSINDFYDIPGVLVPVKLDIGTMTKDYVNGTVLARPQMLGKQIREYIDQKSPPNKRTYPMRVHLNTPTFTFPTAYDPPDFAANFGRILRIRRDARVLAAAALFNLQKTFDLKLDPRNGIKNQSFVGVHLRTEKDVQGSFPSYDEQAAYYLDYIVQNKMGVVFLATGATGENITAFTERARDFNATVVMKKDVLVGANLESLERLSWDQRALVDYEIMLRAGLVTGTAQSSFAWNLAMRRKHAYGVAAPAKSLPNAANSNIQWRDQYSTIYGNSEAGQGMQLTIWP